MVVIAAVDRSDQAGAVVEQARKLADAFETDLQVVHVLSRSELRELERVSFENTGEAVEMERVREAAADIARESAEDIAPEAEAVGLVGDPAQSVVDYVADQDTEYVVVGGRKRSPVGKAIFGSVSQSVLLNVDAPVLAVMQS